MDMCTKERISSTIEYLKGYEELYKYIVTIPNFKKDFGVKEPRLAFYSHAINFVWDFKFLTLSLRIPKSLDMTYYSDPLVAYFYENFKKTTFLNFEECSEKFFPFSIELIPYFLYSNMPNIGLANLHSCQSQINFIGRIHDGDKPISKVIVPLIKQEMKFNEKYNK